MRLLVRFIDFCLRRALGVFEFCNDENCLLRLQISKAPHRLDLPAASVQAGEPVVEIHLWNEHMPSIPPEGPNLVWASRSYRLFTRSLFAAAREIQSHPRYAGVRAIGCVTGVLGYGDRAIGELVMQRLGFHALPYHNRLGRFGEFWENFYAKWLMEAYNPGSLKPRKSLRLHRSDMWMSLEDFLKRYGRDATLPDPAGS